MAICGQDKESRKSPLGWQFWTRGLTFRREKFHPQVLPSTVAIEPVVNSAICSGFKVQRTEDQLSALAQQ